MTSAETPSPRFAARRGLIALNVVLLMVLAAVTLAPASHAQKGSGRARGEYTMTAGRITGGTSHAIYVSDANNQEVLVLLWNQTAKGLDAIGYRDLNADAKAQPTR